MEAIPHLKQFSSYIADKTNSQRTKIAAFASLFAATAENYDGSAEKSAAIADKIVSDAAK